MESVINKFKYSICYVLSVVFINASFAYTPHFELPDGSIWSIGSVVAGLVFIARDFAQREVGHLKILLLMALSGVISYVTSNPFVAFASISAFAISELMDWAVYTKTSGDFRKRVIASSLVGVPIDTVIFLIIIDSISWFGFLVMTASKLIALAFIFCKNSIKD